MLIIRRLANKNSKRQLLSTVLKKKNEFSSSSFILNSGLSDVEIPQVPLHEYCLENISNWEHRTAIECAETGKKYTYSQIRAKSKNLGAALRKKMKLEKDDVIAVLLPNVPEYPIVTLATLRAGLVCTPMNPMYTPDEIARQLIDSSAKCVITLTDFWGLANAAKTISKRDIPILTIPSQQGQSTPTGAVNFAEFTNNHTDFPENNSFSSEDTVFLPYSSGTTGLPKGVQLTHRNIVANFCQLQHPAVVCAVETTANHQDVIPAVLPMFHIYGLSILCMFNLRMGSKILTLPRFTPDIYINSLRKHKPHILYIVPPIALFLEKHPNIIQEDFENVRVIINGSAPLGATDSVKLQDKTKRDIPILQGYGLTETSPAVLTTRKSQQSCASVKGSLGLPLPNTEAKLVSIDDPSGTPLGPNQLGELMVRGPQVMKGYLNRPEEEIFVDGWMRTGDMMYYNVDGFLFITDRLKELIKVKGFQVAPAELEEIIRNFPEVTDAAVIGIPHHADGEVPRAFVVPRDGVKIDIEKLNELVSSKVAPYKQLKGGIKVVDSIPKNAAGKTLRRELKLLYQNEINAL